MQTVASRSRLALAAANLLVITIAVPALAQTPFPSAPVRVIVLFSAGDSGDAVARTPQGSLGVELGQSVIVENRAGGNSVIGTQLVAKAKPDGFTLLQIATNGVIVANLQGRTVRSRP